MHNNLNEQINRTKELMGILTEGFIFTIDLIKFISGTGDGFGGTSELGDEYKGIFRVGKTLFLGVEEDAAKKKSSRHLGLYNFTKGKKEDLPEGVLLPYEIVNETVVFEAGPVIGVVAPEPEAPKVEKTDEEKFEEKSSRMINELGFGEKFIFPCFAQNMPSIKGIEQITIEQIIEAMEKDGYIGTQSDKTGCFYPSTAGRQDMGNLIYTSSKSNNYSQDCKDKLKANKHTEVISCYNKAIINKFGNGHKSMVSR